MRACAKHAFTDFRHFTQHTAGGCSTFLQQDARSPALMPRASMPQKPRIDSVLPLYFAQRNEILHEDTVRAMMMMMMMMSKILDETVVCGMRNIPPHFPQNRAKTEGGGATLVFAPGSHLLSQLVSNFQPRTWSLDSGEEPARSVVVR